MGCASLKYHCEHSTRLCLCAGSCGETLAYEGLWSARVRRSKPNGMARRTGSKSQAFAQKLGDRDSRFSRGPGAACPGRRGVGQTLVYEAALSHCPPPPPRVSADAWSARLARLLHRMTMVGPLVLREQAPHEESFRVHVSAHIRESCARSLEQRHRINGTPGTPRGRHARHAQGLGHSHAQSFAARSWRVRFRDVVRANLSHAGEVGGGSQNLSQKAPKLQKPRLEVVEESTAPHLAIRRRGKASCAHTSQVDSNSCCRGRPVNSVTPLMKYTLVIGGPSKYS